jgi:hypothetical protein
VVGVARRLTREIRLIGCEGKIGKADGGTDWLSGTGAR